MQVQDVRVKINLRLNKADSQDYDNIWRYHVEEAYNKATLDLVRRLVRGKNQTQEGDEETTSRIDDLQPLLKEITLGVREKGVYIETERFPTDYLYYKRLTPRVSVEQCPSQTYIIRSDLREEANVDSYIDFPSFKFEETFHTLIGNKSRVYHNKQFKINFVNLIYYRLPKKVDFSKPLTTLEFKDDLCEMIVDETVKILATDIESANQMQAAQQRIELNN